MAALRLADICRLFRSRYGIYLPDDDAGREDARLAVHHVALTGGESAKRCQAWLELWCPWMQPNDAMVMVKSVLKSPRRYKADRLAQLLNLGQQERQRLGITTIGAVDAVADDRRRASRQRWNTERKKRRREASAERPASQERTAPWKAMGISRATYFRHKNAGKEQAIGT